jgi:ribonuclease HI
MNKNNQTTIFTDGSSRGNPGPGGWGAIVIVNSKKQKEKIEDIKITELGGGEKDTTNNRMELMAAIKGLGKAPKDSEIIVYTDSSYVINGITKWVHGWKRNGWVTKAEEDVLNKDLWMKLDKAATKAGSAGAKIKWQYIGGHIGVLGNERCDHIATAFADGMKIKLYKGPIEDYDLPDILDVSHDEMSLARKKTVSSHSSAKAYSYVSMVDGVIETHHTWPECEKRVKGARGAKYKKSLDFTDEQKIIEEFGTF